MIKEKKSVKRTSAIRWRDDLLRLVRTPRRGCGMNCCSGGCDTGALRPAKRKAGKT